MKLFDVRRGERRQLMWAAAAFFCVLGSYYAIRPVRDAYAVSFAGLNWLFTATFFVMLAATPLYGWIAAHVPRRWLAGSIYGFFVLNLITFRLLLGHSDPVWEVRIQWVFFVWVSVFNMYIVTLFWSTAVDVVTSEASKRLFGVIAAAGTLGGILGSRISALIVGPRVQADPREVLWASAILLSIAALCVTMLRRTRAAVEENQLAREPEWKAAVRGISDTFRSPYLAVIASWILLTSIVATFIYFERTELMRTAIVDQGSRTQWLANLDTYQLSLTLVGQGAAASWLMRRLGLGATLMIVPAVYGIGFLGMALWPTLAVIGALDVAQRVVGFAIGVPAREVLFTTVAASEKYRAKAFIDTVGKRAGDATAAHGYALAKSSGWLTFASAAVLGPMIVLTAILSWIAGRQHVQQTRDLKTAAPDKADASSLTRRSDGPTSR